MRNEITGLILAIGASLFAGGCSPMKTSETRVDAYEKLVLGGKSVPEKHYSLGVGDVLGVGVFEGKEGPKYSPKK